MNINISDEKDILVMKLIHYFVTKKDYSPIIIRGVENEIWLENSKEEFGIIRIVTKNLYNNEQYDFDIFKIENILNKIKRKTLNPFVKVLTIYTSVGDNFDKKIEDQKKYKFVIIRNEEELYDKKIITDNFKDIKENMVFDEEGFALLGKMASNISKKNIEENVRINDMLKMKKPILTYLLIGINVILFILMYILGNGSEDANTLIDFGANYSKLTLAGDYYRLISSAFLHIGFIHILCNMYALFILGPNIESFFGKWKYLLIYFYSAIIGSLFSLVFDPNTVTAGASGAIFGLLGALLYFGYNYRGYIGNRIINSIIPVIITNLFIGFVVPGISNASHIGGLIGGISISYLLGTSEDKDLFKRVTGFIITAILTIFMIYLAFFKA